MDKQKVRLVYANDNNYFVGDLLIHHNVQDYRLSTLELTNLVQTKNWSETEGYILELRYEPEWFLRYCVEYKYGVELVRKMVNARCNHGTIYLDLKSRMTNLADRLEYQDKVFSKLVINDQKLFQELKTRTFNMEVSKQRDFIIALYNFGRSCVQNFLLVRI